MSTIMDSAYISDIFHLRGVLGFWESKKQEKIPGSKNKTPKAEPRNQQLDDDIEAANEKIEYSPNKHIEE